MSDPQNDSNLRSDAASWLREVDGRLMFKRDAPDGEDGWVVIVKTPAATGRKARVILGFGDSAMSAVSTAQDTWREVWREISTLH